MIMMCSFQAESVFFFFFNDTATTEIYTLSLHDALPILLEVVAVAEVERLAGQHLQLALDVERELEVLADRKSTRLNSSHSQISYAVFCLKKKNNTSPNTSQSRRISSFVIL